ncbi:hypothetical protein FACS1894200_07310 [Spirochaetia bacterium]|nr:hypothetical protein FACS1894200_07310 [Spirochaetia bacterium]
MNKQRCLICGCLIMVLFAVGGCQDFFKELVHKKPSPQTKQEGPPQTTQDGSQTTQGDNPPPQYTVTYDANGASGTVPLAQKAPSGTVVYVAGYSGLTNADKTFSGWNTNASGGGGLYAVGSSLTVTDNITLYAQWIPTPSTTYTVTYNANGGNTPPPAQTAPAGTSVAVAGPGSMTYPGKAFSGWTTGGGTSYVAGSSLTVTADITLYAQWVMPADMVRIQGGTFTMGSPANEAGRYSNEGPQHQVTVSGFSMSKTEVTQAQWRELMGTTIQQQRDKAYPGYSLYGEGDNYPMYYVSWYDAVAYCNARSLKEGLTPVYTINGTNVSWNQSANGYRLPTEAEWEYACRAGTTTPYSSGSSVDTAGWYSSNSGNKTHPVGTKQANAWGLHDMHGNVWEWCWDWYSAYSSGAQTDPMGAASGSDRVVRGGSWGVSAQSLRSANRGSHTPADGDNGNGFRLARP